MEGILEKLGWKKVAALLIAVSLFGLIFVFLSLTDSDKAALLNKKSAQNPSNNTGGTNFEITKAPQQNTVTNANKTYITPFYEISYPENYQAEPYTSPDGILSEVKLHDTTSDNRIEIIVYPAGSNTIASLSKPLDYAGYAKKTIFINSMQGVEYEGGSKTLSAHEKVAILPKDTNLISVQLTYRGIQNLKLESEFDAILQSIK